ncbi:MAG TPA: helix-turn-helix transcriptional regulator [Candidatus Tyrphobacter sp.]
MNSILQAFLQRSTSRTFRRSLAFILVAEAITIVAAWLLLDGNVSRWIHERSAQAVRISQETAASEDWSLVGTIPRKRDSALFESYNKKLEQIWHERFPHNEGDISLVVVENGREYAVDPTDPIPMDDLDDANRWELAAYASRQTTYNLIPYSDNTGTYLAAYTPIIRSGKVVGLVEAEYDSATLPDLRGIVQRAFWLSILPALLLALVVAYVLASMFVEPMEIFRRIDETAATRIAGGTSAEDPLARLTPREREVAELVRKGLKNKEIAESLVVTPETVKQHLKNIKEKTGFTRVDLAVHAEANRLLAV